jgi:serine/threonine protein kinase
LAKYADQESGGEIEKSGGEKLAIRVRKDYFNRELLQRIKDEDVFVKISVNISSSDPFIESNILQKAAENHVSSVVEMLCNLSVANSFCHGIALEKASCDAAQFFFRDYPYQKCFAIPESCELQSHEQLLKVFVAFCENVLDFLRHNGIVYCDWKLENVLIFDRPSFRFKLTDFASTQQHNMESPNPRNVNQIFTSPALSYCLPVIKPTFEDDYFGVKCLLYKLNGCLLPWEAAFLGTPDHITESERELVLAMLCYMKSARICQPCLAGLVYWPEWNDKPEIWQWHYDTVQENIWPKKRSNFI